MQYIKQSTSPTSLSQEAVVPTQHSASTRSESTCSIERVRRDPSREPEENQNLNNNKDNERVRGDPLRDLSEWLDESTENLVDERVREHGDASSHFGSRAISCLNVHGVFPFTSASGFALSKCLQPSFVVPTCPHGTCE